VFGLCDAKESVFNLNGISQSLVNYGFSNLHIEMEDAKEKRLAAKRTFFNELHRVHDEETETEDEDDNEAVKFLSEERKGSEFTKHNTTPNGDLLPLNMGRTMSSPLPIAKVPPPRLPAVSSVKNTPHGASSSHMQPGNQSGISAKATSFHMPRREEQTKPGMRKSKKRKRGKSLEPLPVSQQIFDGKTFCTSAGIPYV
jgi:hypothetical protein